MQLGWRIRRAALWQVCARYGAYIPTKIVGTYAPPYDADFHWLGWAGGPWELPGMTAKRDLAQTLKPALPGLTIVALINRTKHSANSIRAIQVRPKARELLNLHHLEDGHLADPSRHSLFTRNHNSKSTRLAVQKPTVNTIREEDNSIRKARVQFR